MTHQFWGSEVCCGTYACMNYLEKAKGTRIQSYRDFEIAASVPFGIRYIERPHYDRMLTPLCNPNEGINRAAKIYGYEVEQHNFQMLKELMGWLEKHLIDAPVILGPVDMGNLFYLPMSAVYRAADHYVVLSYVSDNQVEILESEGIGRIVCTYEVLRQIIDIRNIPEAGGLLTVRRLIGRQSVSETVITGYSWEGAVENYNYTHEHGENCFRRCGAAVKTVPAYIWKNSLLYESAILLQRKYLFLHWLDKVYLAGIIEKKKRENLETIIKNQSTKLSELLGQIKRNCINPDIFEVLGDMECKLGEEVIA